jgi:hypothetical protein
MPVRQQRAHTEEWQRLQQYCLWPEQRRYETQYRSPQLALWERDAVTWNLVRRLPDYTPRWRGRARAFGEHAVEQLPLFSLAAEGS